VIWYNRLHPQERVHIIRDRERKQYKYMEEDDHFTLTQLPALTYCCPWQQLLFLSYSPHILCSLSALLLPIYRQEWRHQLQLFFNKGGCQLQLFNNGGCQPLTSWMGAHGWCNSSCRLLTMATSPRVGLLPHKWQYPNNHPLCHLCGATVRLLLQHRLASVALPSLPF